MRHCRALWLLVPAILLAAGSAEAKPPKTAAEAASTRALAAKRFKAGDRDGAIGLMRDVIVFDRKAAPASAELATDLDVLASELDAPDDDNLWDDAEDLRLEALEILAKLPKSEAGHREALAALTIHYVRREYGRDFAERALQYFDLVAGENDGRDLAKALIDAACRAGHFDDFPALGLDFATAANAYLSRFGGGDDAAVVCEVRALKPLLDLRRELDGLLARSGELVELAGATSVGVGAAVAAIEFRARILLSAGLFDEALTTAELAAARTASGDVPAASRARALALHAEALLRTGNAEAAAREATDAVLAYEGVEGADGAHAEALTLLAEILSIMPDRQGSVAPLLARARDIAGKAATTREEGWEEALKQSYTLTVSWFMAQRDPQSASAAADELAQLRSSTLKLAWVQDWAFVIGFPANVALLLYRHDYEGARYQLENTVYDDPYFKEHNYFASPLTRADVAEYTVLLDLLSTPADQPLDGEKLVGLLDEALKAREESLPETHPLLIQHYGLRAVLLARLGRAEEALAAAREGLARYVKRGASPNERGGAIAGLFVDPVYEQLVTAAWLGAGTLPE